MSCSADRKKLLVTSKLRHYDPKPEARLECYCSAMAAIKLMCLPPQEIYIECCYLLLITRTFYLFATDNLQHHWLILPTNWLKMQITVSLAMSNACT